MLIDYGSDLHLGIGSIDSISDYQGSDTLVLAGDIIEYVLLKKKNPKYIKFFTELNSKYKKIIFVLGNHEHYKNSFFHTKRNFETIFTKLGFTNFIVLENQTTVIGDTMFFGATMWTTMRSRNPLSMNVCHAKMNDYQYIHYVDYGDKIKITPEYTISACEFTLRKIQDFCTLDIPFKKVLVTHHAPCFLSVPDRFRAYTLNDAYYEDIGTMLSYSNISLSIHGHIHDEVGYNLGGCRVISNPRGYTGKNSPMYKFKTIEV